MSSKVYNRAGRMVWVLIAFVLFAVLIVAIQIGRVYADYPRVFDRSLTIGTTEPGAATDYLFRWRWPTNTSIGSVRLLLCSDAYVTDPCAVTPPGDFGQAVLTNQSGALGGFSIASQSVNEIVLSRGAAGMTGTGQYSFEFENMINPTGVHMRFFVQIFTYTSTDATGTATHMASVTNATAEPIVITTEVPPYLFFCAALTVDEWCENVDGNFIDYDELSPAVEDSATSQFGVATNAQGGYVVTINGSTMTAGNKTIAPLGVLSANAPGTPQFGLNLRANTNPALGQDAFGAGIGVVAAEYDVPDMFKFVDGDIVASAATGTTFNTYTVTYIVNVPPDQPSGIYNTTIAFICTAAF